MLEEYLLGLTDDSQSAVVENMLDAHPEVQAEYERLQDDIEAFCGAYAQAPPADLKAQILEGIEVSSHEGNTLSGSRRASADNVVRLQRRGMNWVSAAASVVALVAVSAALYFWNQQQTLLAELDFARKERALIVAQLERLNSNVAQTTSMYSLAYHPKTTSVLLQGEVKSEEIGVVAYWNPETQQSFLNVLWLPELEGKCFQLWADVHGEMISLGVLDLTQAPFAPIEFKLDAESLNITIEPQGGSDHPTVSDLVSSIPI